ncbi:MAG: endo-1,4-beta-xylanase [Bacteroidia bacterium]|nr:endo-1,4-beta-xylanase [Bacteroidia bacterium]
MNNISKIIAGLGVAALFTACADDDIAYVKVVKPAGLDTYAYLDQYNVLKSYAKDNSKIGPNFKLGAALEAADYNQKSTIYALANSNFDEVVAGNAMKFASCVNDKGEMDFGTVEDFVIAAEEQNATVFGHTLAWHSQQNKKWLESLIADKVVSLDAQDQTIFKFVFDDDQGFGGWGNSSTFTIVEGEGVDGTKCIKISNPSAVNFWEAQAAIDQEYEANRDYVLKMSVRASAEGVLRAGFQNPKNYAGCGDFPLINLSTEWKQISVSTTATDGAARFLFSFGDFAGDIFIDNLELIMKAKAGNKSTTIGNVQPVSIQMTSLFDDNILLNKAGSLNLRAVAIHATAKKEQAWDNQFFLKSTRPFKTGEVTKVAFRYRATKKAKASTQIHANPGAYKHWMAIGDVNFTEEWQDFEADFTIPSEAANEGQTIAFNLSEFAEENDYYFDNLSWTDADGNELVVNGNCEGDDVTCFYSTVGQQGPNPSKIEEIAFPSIIVKATAKKEQAWDNQFFIVSNKVLAAGANTKLSFKYKATSPAKASTQCHKMPGEYIHWAAIGDVNYTKEWQDFEIDFTIPAECDGKDMRSIAFNLNEFAEANDYYFRDIVWTLDGESLITNGDLKGDDFSCFVARIYGKGDSNANSEEISVFEKVDANSTVIKLTPEQKKDTLTWAMNKWINGMIKATAGKVTAWDLVNESVGGADTNGNGFYNLQSAATATEDDQKNNFYWQDYLGDVDYVVIAEKAARKAFAEIEGTNPDDLKLFVNDYNLEQTWGNLDKVKSYVQYWIPEWEKAGAKIDGIGTQMHVSYSEDPQQQEWQENRIVEMFKIMASSGKLVRVSELDMCYKTADGKELDGNLTYEQEQKMAGFYNFILRAYLDNVPAAQQYGFTVWCITDAPADKSWRHKTISSLWSTDYYRKPAYAGIADALQGKTFVEQPKAE